jgi:hypothetical protein
MKHTTFLALLLTIGCTPGEPEEETGDPETDTSDTSEDTDDTTTTDLCAPQPASTQVISETQMDVAYPTAVGGTVVDGTYDLVRFEVYPSATADAHTRARRLIFAGDTAVFIQVDDGTPEPILGATFATTGAEITFTVTCPSETAMTLPYSVVGEEFWLFDPSEPNIQVYNRQ